MRTMIPEKPPRNRKLTREELSRRAAVQQRDAEVAKMLRRFVEWFREELKGKRDG